MVFLIKMRTALSMPKKPANNARNRRDDDPSVVAVELDQYDAKCDDDDDDGGRMTIIRTCTSVFHLLSFAFWVCESLHANSENC